MLFRYILGREPTPQSNLAELFGTAGTYAAKLHRHAAGWRRPADFERQSWQAGTILDVDGPWGDWRIAPGVTAQNRRVLDHLDATLWMRLAEYGLRADRYGLIHADMRLGNLLVDGDHVSLIDFDDCGFCWFTCDFAAAISFHETDPASPALKSAWLERYQAVRPLDAEDIASIDSMVMLRRMALLAWLGSHAETDLAQLHMPGLADGTAALAELDQHARPLDAWAVVVVDGAGNPPDQPDQQIVVPPVIGIDDRRFSNEHRIGGHQGNHYQPVG
ncbi:MAG: phosphotransferase [Candidatus Devosia euplotis]|nr:phosphotransferase [Candidatus Devosia euplotis]